MNLSTSFKAIRAIYNYKVWKNAISENDAKVSAKFLQNIFSQEKGVFLKIGQMLGSSETAVDEFKELCKTPCGPVPLDELLPIIDEMVEGIDSVFKYIDPQGIPASIGQVHKAVLLDGTEVAIKVQYPFIRKSIENQLKLLNIFPLLEKIGPAKKWGIPISDYRKLIENTINEELNYFNEIENHLRFRAQIKDESAASTSTLFPQFSLDNIYVQSWIEGVDAGEVVNCWSEGERYDVAQALAINFINSLFVHGFIQADTNHGNFIFNRDKGNGVNVHYIDFGNCLEIPPSFRLALLKLIYAPMTNDNIDPIDYLGLLDFNTDKLEHIHPQLALLMKIVFEPFISDYAFDFRCWKLGEQIDIALGPLKWWFRASGSTRFFVLMKSFIGIKNLVQKLDVKLNWKKLLLKQTSALLPQLESIKPISTMRERFTFEAIAKYVKVNVIKDGVEKINISMPISTLPNLADFMEKDTLEKLQKRQVDIANIIDKTLKQGCYPGEIFLLEEARKTVRVFIE